MVRLFWIGLCVCYAAALAPLARCEASVRAERGMIVCSESLACEAGAEILRAGGNAIDAAVAVGFALAVTYPAAGNIGGGGFMLIRLAKGEAVVVDYREEAPGAASHDMFLDTRGDLIPGASIRGALAAAVPGTVAGLALAEEKYGNLGLARVLKPAIRLAQGGFPVGYSLNQSFRGHQEFLSQFPESRRIFLRDGRPYAPGEVLRQPELARTLHELARRGPSAFYSGDIAKAIVATMERHGGIIRLNDLMGYQAKLREPLRGQFRGCEILTVPLPSSGGVLLIQMLNVLEPLALAPPNSFGAVRLMAETMRRAYADRAAYLGDADYASVPLAGLLSPKYAAQLRAEVTQAKAEAAVHAGNPFESSETTHYSVVDAEGNAVANTYTLNGAYGCGVTVEGAGFLLNNEMDDFAGKPGRPNMFGLIQGEANAIAPRKRPLSSMTPTLVLQDGRVRLVLGSPGGPTITNTVLQVILNVLVHKMDLARAVAAPRFHHQWQPNELVLECESFSADTLEELKQAGYRLACRASMGECLAVEIDPETGWRLGVADPRGNGKAVGY